MSLQTRLDALITAIGADIKALQASGTPLATVVTNASGNTVYPDNKSYFKYVVTADGFPVNGMLTGIRVGTNHTQRMQDVASAITYSRNWNNTTSLWSAWVLYTDAQDYDAKGDLLVGTGSDTYTRQPIGTDGQVLMADSASADGMKWETPASGGGGGADPWTTQRVMVDYANATITGSDVFAGFAPAANTTYVVETKMIVRTALGTTAIQTALAGPASGITNAAIKINSAASATADLISHIATLNTFQVATAGLTTNTLLIIEGLVVVGALPGAGNIRVQARSEVAASAVTVAAGSMMRWRTIA